MSYYAAAEKKIGDKHVVNIAALGSPTDKARKGIALQEA